MPVDKARKSETGRIYALYRNHGLRPEDVWAMRVAQSHKCYLCGNYLPLDLDPSLAAEYPGERTHIDHDHRCCPTNRSCRKCRRGLVHIQCNMIAGLAGEDPAKLRRIADNLEAAQARLGPFSPPPPTLFDEIEIEVPNG